MEMNAVIFDFDGTIADTWKITFEILKENQEEWGLPDITVQTIADFRGKSFFALIKKYNIVLFKLPFIVSKTQKELKKRMDYIPLFKGIKDVIIHLKRKGFRLGILSTNAKDNIELFLKHHGIDAFDFIQSERSLLGKDTALRNVLRKNNLKEKDVIYIGDEVRDIDACKEVRVKIIAVTWGFNTKKLLKENKPDFLIDAPSEILKIVSK